jgi:hypothetical protein
MNVRNGALVLGLLFATAGLVQADGAKSIKVSLLSDTSWNGTAIPAGDYTIAWTEANTDADVTLTSHGKVVAQGKAKLVEQKDASSSDQIVSRKDAKGALALAEIRFRGKKEALVLSQS